MSDRAEWRSSELGEMRELELTGGPLRAYVRGQGPAIVFVHGLLVNANLWRKVVPGLAKDFRCISLDLPLGSHLVGAPDADLSPTGLADMIGEAIGALGAENATVVGNDTGGGLCQVFATRSPDRLGRLVLTSSDAFENFPPRFFRNVLAPARVPAVVPLAFAALRMRGPRRLPIAFGWLTHSSIEREAEDSYALPPLTRREIRRDLARVLKGLNPRYTLDAAERLAGFDKPVLIAWSADDRFLPREHAERLATIIPDARLEWIEDSRTFSPEDQPARLAELIAGFVRQGAPAAA
ncbi:MAG: alpha/beta fold hydrolase [Thermoleophilaceae bacterium]